MEARSKSRCYVAMVPPSQAGQMEILGDIVSPVIDENDIEALRD